MKCPLNTLRGFSFFHQSTVNFYRKLYLNQGSRTLLNVMRCFFHSPLRLIIGCSRKSSSLYLWLHQKIRNFSHKHQIYHERLPVLTWGSIIHNTKLNSLKATQKLSKIHHFLSLDIKNGFAQICYLQ